MLNLPESPTLPPLASDWQFCCTDFYRASYASTVVCPSVCPSVTSRSCTKTAKSRITQTTSYDSPGTLIVWRQNSRWNSNDITPTAVPNRGGVGSHRRFSANISLYLRNGARQGHTYYGRRIETHMRSVEWLDFQWPWVTLTTPFSTFCDAFHISVTSEDRRFKFGGAW